MAATLAVAGETLGYDFLAYHRAAVRVLDGEPLYDLGFQAAGGFGLFLYPPLFAPLILPFGLLSETIAIWAWVAGANHYGEPGNHVGSIVLGLGAT